MQMDLATIIAGILARTQTSQYGSAYAENTVNTLVRLKRLWPNMQESDRIELQSIIDSMVYGYGLKPIKELDKNGDVKYK